MSERRAVATRSRLNLRDDRIVKLRTLTQPPKGRGEIAPGSDSAKVDAGKSLIVGSPRDLDSLGSDSYIGVVGRVRQMIAVNGKKCWTLFDSGARHTYVTPEVASLLKTSPTPRTIRTSLGGSVKETNTQAVLDAEIEGHAVSTLALVIPNIGRDEDGKPIEILFGALAMQLWGIKLNPSEEKLDLTNYPEEFVEF